MPDLIIIVHGDSHLCDGSFIMVLEGMMYQVWITLLFLGAFFKGPFPSSFSHMIALITELRHWTLEF